MHRTRRMINRRSGRSKRGGVHDSYRVDEDKNDRIIETLLNMKNHENFPLFTPAQSDRIIEDQILKNQIIRLIKAYEHQYPYYVIIGAIASALQRNKINAFFVYDDTNDIVTNTIDDNDANVFFRKYRKHYWDDKKENDFQLQGGKSRRRSHRRANKKSRKGRKSRKSHRRLRS